MRESSAVRSRWYRISACARGAALSAFALLTACDDLAAPKIGGIQVTVITSGDDIDQDGYVLVLDSATTRRLDPNDVVRVDRVPFGTHRVGLSGVADNCTVAETLERSVTVTRGSLVAIEFRVNCAFVGIRISVVTTGGDTDLDGFIVSLDGVIARYVTPVDVDTIRRLSTGPHTVDLSGVAPNCRVVGENPALVTVGPRGLVPVDFIVDCAAYTGTLDIRAITSGVDIDLDGYLIRMDNTAGWYLSPTATVRLQRVEAGTHTIQLDGLASNCLVPDNPRDVALPIGATLAVDFHVTCTKAEKFAFSRFSYPRFSVLVAYGDGSNQRLVAEGLEPTWSPDGTQLAFARGYCDLFYYPYYGCASGGLGIVDGNGGTPRVVTSGIDQNPAWSPEGSLIAFARLTQGRLGLFLVNINGTTPTPIALPALVGQAWDPAWSPDGNKLAFTCLVGPEDQSDAELCIVNRDGSGFVRLTTAPGWDAEPAWSPDGTRIAYSTSRSPPTRIAVIPADGSGPPTFLAEGYEPAWSRDGRIVYTATNGRGLHLMNADGSGVLRLTTTPDDRGPAWRP